MKSRSRLWKENLPLRFRKASIRYRFTGKPCKYFHKQKAPSRHTINTTRESVKSAQSQPLNPNLSLRAPSHLRFWTPCLFGETPKTPPVTGSRHVTRRNLLQHPDVASQQSAFPGGDPEDVPLCHRGDHGRIQRSYGVAPADAHEESLYF